MSRGSTGTAMQIVRTRFEPDSKPGPKQDHKLADRIPEVRRLLRTDLSIGQIAAQLGVCAPSLRHFIRRRGICDIAARAQFIGRQKTLSRSA